jgi:hypothetical protein
VAVAYANLDDAVAHGWVDPVKLDRETMAALRRARSEGEAIRALAAFVGAFQDSHFKLVPTSHPWFRTGALYDVRLQADGERVVLTTPLPAPCALQPGDPVARVNGRPVKAWLAELEPLAGIRNPVQRRNLALILLTRGPFAPPEALVLEGPGPDEARVTCRLAPATPPPVPAAPATPAPAPTAPSTPAPTAAPAPPAAPAALTFALDAKAACAVMGFKERPAVAPFEGTAVPGFELLADPANAFPAGLLTLAPGRTWGVVRIPLFSEDAYPAVCLATWDAYRAGKEGACDEECRYAFFSEAVTPRLLADLAARVRRFQEAKVEGVVVDLTGNGGGTDWVDPAARLFGPRPMACPELGVIRHPHWSKRLERFHTELNAGLTLPELPPLSESDRRLLTEARDRVAKLAVETRRTCSREGLWSKKGVTKACPGVVRGLHACGLLPYVPPDALAGRPTRQNVFEALGFRFEEALHTGPLVVLVDGRTASAAEYAAAMLKDSGGARLVGARTHGSGCGYTNGGVPVVLRHSGLKVQLSDCARYRRDGTNEVEGLTPDLAVPWGPLDTPVERARKWMDTLRAGLTPP